MVCVTEDAMPEDAILELERSFDDVDTRLLVGIEDNALDGLVNTDN